MAPVVTVCLAGVLPFASTLRSYFLSDDFGLVRQFSRQPPLYFLSLFTRPWVEAVYGGLSYDELRPTLALTYHLDSLWGAASPAAYHVTNIGLHVLTTLLALAIARSVAGLTLPAATFAAVLFAVLPVHAETVAWISGRADSIPTLLYVASFWLYARWRKGGPATLWLYGASLGLAILALYSKQSAITIVATLVAFDVLVARRPFPLSWRAASAYAPFALATLCYLGVRYALFGQAVREDRITAHTFLGFGVTQAVHLRMLVSSLPVLGPSGISPAILSAGAVAALLLVGLAIHRTAPARRGLLLFFGPVWWLIGTAPLMVTYPTPRHLYLAAVGPAIALGIGLEALWTTRRQVWRRAAVLAGAGLVVVNAVRLEREVAEWNAAAAVSEMMARDVQQQAGAAPAGTLLVLGVPAEGVRPGVGLTARHALWSWALPFAVQPPFTGTDLTQRAFFVMPPEAYCCPRTQWLTYTHGRIRAWAAHSERLPAAVLVWDAETGALARTSDTDDPGLPLQILGLLDAHAPTELCQRLGTILRQRGAPLGERWQRTVDWRCTT